MVRSSVFLHRPLSDSFKRFFFIPTSSLILITCFTIFLSIYSTSLFLTSHHQQLKQLEIDDPQYNQSQQILIAQPDQTLNNTVSNNDGYGSDAATQYERLLQSLGDKEVFHDKYTFHDNYKEMKKSFKIYVYPHKKDDPYAHALLPVDFEPGGNYASESYFKKNLMQSHFITKDPSEADLFFLPFSIARLRHDSRIGVGGIQDFVKSYVYNISQKYPYWNRSGGADHFYVACHSIGRSAMEKAEEVKFNTIQVVCSSSYFLSGYVAHKDACLPQIWPRQGDPPNVDLSNRKRLAFFAGAVNSPVRKKVLEAWKNDTDIFVNSGRLATPYSDQLLGSKYCLHVKGFEVNTARIGDAIYYGCVPVIIANHYDLPFADILDWKSFSIVVATLDIPKLKEILLGVNSMEYKILQRNVVEVQKHFQWNIIPKDYDIFYMVMYELWLRRSPLTFSSSEFLGLDEQYTNSGVR
ncbi:lactose synthase [Ranunculus cassubicifolius]